jgi:hypothetical protein
VPALAPQPCGVDEDERPPVAAQDGVDRVPRRPRRVRDDHALAPEERVQEARFADVRPAEDRDADRFLPRHLRRRAGQQLDDRIQ